MKSEGEFRLEARLQAMEWTICQLMVAFVASNSAEPAAALAAMHQTLLLAARERTFPDLGDAAKSDLMSAELEAAFARLATMQTRLAEELEKLRRGQQSGER